MEDRNVCDWCGASMPLNTAKCPECGKNPNSREPGETNERPNQGEEIWNEWAKAWERVGMSEGAEKNRAIIEDLIDEWKKMDKWEDIVDVIRTYVEVAKTGPELMQDAIPKGMDVEAIVKNMNLVWEHVDPYSTKDVHWSGYAIPRKDRVEEFLQETTSLAGIKAIWEKNGKYVMAWIKPAEEKTPDADNMVLVKPEMKERKTHCRCESSPPGILLDDGTCRNCGGVVKPNSRKLAETKEEDLICPRCGRDRGVYDLTFTKDFKSVMPGQPPMAKVFRACQPCIAEITGFIDALTPKGYRCQSPKCPTPAEIRVLSEDDRPWVVFYCDEHYHQYETGKELLEGLEGGSSFVKEE